MIDLDSSEIQDFLLVARPTKANARVRSLIGWLNDHNTELHRLLNEHGALLFRDFDIQGAEAFEVVCRAGTPGLVHYTGGGSPRSLVSGKVYTSTTYSADQHIPLHCEESYFPQPPRHIWFYCEQAPTFGGETPIGDMKKVLDRLDAGLVERFQQRGVRYIYNLHGGKGFGRGWKEAFLTDNRSEVEAWLKKHGASYHWRRDGTLHMDLLGPAVRTHAETGVHVWGNQAVNWHVGALGSAMVKKMRRVYGSEENYPKHATFADGIPIPDEDIRQILDVLSMEEVVFPWQSNDILLCDNHRVAHGRRPYVGQRRVLVALA